MDSLCLHRIVTGFSNGRADERLKVMVLHAVALQAQGKQDQAVYLLCDALTLAKPGGFIRLFFDEGPPDGEPLI